MKTVETRQCLVSTKVREINIYFNFPPAGLHQWKGEVRLSIHH
jgi:hypothetical protein